MKNSDVSKYLSMLIEIKGRTQLISDVSEGRLTIYPQPAKVEFIYLQFRKMIELIAMGSLLANASEYNKAYSNIKKLWKAKDILKNMESINPEFYPRPIIQKPSNKAGITMDWEDRKDDYLNKDRFATLYDKCNGILHSSNPFTSERDYDALEKESPKWYWWIINLLNAHTIKLVGDVNLYLFQMGSNLEEPSYNVFAPHDSTK
jgi:hypothetical protein